MKRTLLTLLSVLFCAITFAQSVPQGINYQAVARDASGAVLMNQALTIQFSVISDITTSAVSWQETHSVTTNDYGLYTAIIGQGTSTSVGSSASFDVIDWGASNHLLKVEVDYGGGIFVDMGTTAFMSVPYSMNALSSTPQSLTISGDTLFISSGNYIILPSSAPTLLGCTDSTASNYEALANTDDGSCIINGCMDSTANNYNPNATTNTFPGGVSASFNNNQTVNFPVGNDYYLLQPGYDYVAYENGSSNWIGLSATDTLGIPLGYGACCANSFVDAQTWYSNVAPALFTSIQSYTFTSPGSYSFVASDDGCYSESFTIIVTDSL